MGGASVAVRRYPRLLAEAEVAGALREALQPAEEQVETGGDLSLAGVACKAAIKVNQPLSLLEMQQLADDLFACENPDFCPHRRPIVVHIHLEEIEKRVRRR
jgi:DNA mismatch repair protein MutL